MKNKIIYTLILALFFTACDESLLDVKNDDSYDGSTFFSTAASYEEASTAMYSVLYFRGMYSSNYFIFDLFGHDAKRHFALEGAPLEFPSFSHSPNNSELNFLWISCYKLVFRANFVLDLMENWDTEEDAELKQQITGEAHFMKAFAYFFLVNCYGDVPLRQTLADHEIIEFERTPKEQVWAAIEADLKSAINELPVFYDDENWGRATRGAAVALLGKSYLFQQKYSEAITELNKLRSAPYTYDLAPSLDDMFIYDQITDETVFAVVFGEYQEGVGSIWYSWEGQETWGGQATHSDRAMEYGFNDWWNVLVADDLVDAFTYEDESSVTYIDPRAALTFYSAPSKGGDTTFCDDCETTLLYVDEVAGGDEYVSWRKYQMYEYLEVEGRPISGINSQVIRYADVLLMLAEAYIETNAISSALPLINEVRARSGAFEYTTLGTQTQAREIVRRERRLELAGEYSRYFDLIRWGIFVETVNAEKLDEDGTQPVKDYHVLFPIPQPERDANPILNEQVNNNWN